MNVFGTTFYSLVGLHSEPRPRRTAFAKYNLCAHAVRERFRTDHIEHTEMISWYWHFVDGIWVVVPHSRLLHQPALLTMKHDPPRHKIPSSCLRQRRGRSLPPSASLFFRRICHARCVSPSWEWWSGLLAAVGWCLDLFPHPKHEPVPLRPPSEHPEPIRTAGRVVRILEVGKMSHRARIPVEVHPYTAGAFGGLVGAVVMAALACVYGIFKYGSIW